MKQGHIAVLAFLLGLGIDVSVKVRLGNTPRDDAIMHKHDSAVAMLTEHGGTQSERSVKR